MFSFLVDVKKNVVRLLLVGFCFLVAFLLSSQVTHAVVNGSSGANIINENEYFPFDQQLAIDKDANIKNFKVEVSGNGNNTIGYNIPSGHIGIYGIDFMNYGFKDTTYYNFDSKYRAYTLYFKDIKDIKNIKLTTTHEKAGSYNGRAIDIRQTFSKFEGNNTVLPFYSNNLPTHFIQVSESPYSGFVVWGVSYFDYSIEFFYSDTKESVNFDGGSAFLSANSLNGALATAKTKDTMSSEYVSYLNLKNLNDIFVKKDNNLRIGNMADLKKNNILPDYTKVFDGLSVMGENNNFTDKLGGETFERNSALFKTSGTKQSFRVGSTNNNQWFAISSAVINYKPDPPKKSVNNQDGEDINGKDVTNRDSLIYKVDQKVGKLGTNTLSRYSKFIIEDSLAKEVKFQRAELYRNGKLIESRKQIVYDANKHKVTFIGDSTFLNDMPMEGETYTVKIYTEVLPSDSDDGKQILIKNKAHTIIDNSDQVSNEVVNKYVPPVLKINVERIQIDTSKAEKSGFLPTVVTFSKEVTHEDRIDKKLKYEISFVDIAKGEVVFAKQYKLEDFVSEDVFRLPTDYLTKNKKIDYLISINLIEENKGVDFETETKNVPTYGFTSSEKVLTNADLKGTNVDYKAVVRTIKERTKEGVQELNEQISYGFDPKIRTKTGYGIELEFFPTYINEIGKKTNMNLYTYADNNLIDNYINEAYKEGHSQTEIKLDQTKNESKDESGVNVQKLAFEFPHMNVERKTGNLFTDDQKSKKDSNIKYDLIDGGRSFYIPIWADLGKYEIDTKSNVFGSNLISVEMTKTADVYAYMYATVDSETSKEDELLLMPVYPDSAKPEGWNQNELNWLRK